MLYTLRRKHRRTWWALLIRGLLGLAVGIWALVVLCSEDVRHAFRKPETSNLAGGGYPR